jgi:hypothetical protein
VTTTNERILEPGTVTSTYAVKEQLTLSIKLRERESMPWLTKIVRTDYLIERERERERERRYC